MLQLNDSIDSICLLLIMHQSMRNHSMKLFVILVGVSLISVIQYSESYCTYKYPFTITRSRGTIKNSRFQYEEHLKPSQQTALNSLKQRHRLEHRRPNLLLKISHRFQAFLHEIGLFFRRIIRFFRSLLIHEGGHTNPKSNIIQKSKSKSLPRPDTDFIESNKVLLEKPKVEKVTVEQTNDPIHEAYLHRIREDQQKHYVENVLKDIARMKERTKDLVLDSNTTLGIIDTESNRTSVLDYLRSNDSNQNNTVTSNSSLIEDRREKEKEKKEKKYANLPKSVQKFVGSWQLVEERYRNDSSFR